MPVTINMISAYWGSPQSGKTTLAVETALALGSTGKSVCIISAEDFAEMGPRFGTVVSSDNGITLATRDSQGIRAIALPVAENVFLLAPSAVDSAMSLAFSNTQALNILKTAAAIYDEVILDCTTWKGNALTGAGISLATNLIIPIPGKVSTLPWLLANQKPLEQKSNIAIYIKNETMPNFDYEALFKSMLGIDPSITVPYVSNMTSHQNEGQPIWTNANMDKQFKAYRKAIRSLVRDIYI